MSAPWLHRYQDTGASFLATHPHALLADEMGLGKTAQAIEAASRLGLTKGIIVCPAIARTNWSRECTKWFATLTPSILSYDYITDHPETAAQLAGEVLILDEAHYLKNPEARRTQAVWGRLAHQFPRVWALSATPTPNHAGEIWSLLFSFGGTPMHYEEWCSTVCRMKWNAHARRYEPTGTKDAKAVARCLQPFMMKRTVREVMPELPPLEFHDCYVDAEQLPSEIMEQYFADIPAAQVAEQLKRELTLATTQSDLEGGFDQLPTLRRWIGANKVAGVAQLVTEELDAKAYDRTVVWYFHKQVGAALLNAFRKRFTVAHLEGGMSETARWQAVDAFNEGRAQVIVAQYQAGGLSINLPSREEIFCEYDWNPATNMQAAKRCQRAAAGITYPTRARFAILPGGVDDVVLAVARRKTRETAAIYQTSPFG